MSDQSLFIAECHRLKPGLLLGAVCKKMHHTALLSSSLHCGTCSCFYGNHGEVYCSTATHETNKHPNVSWRVHPEAAIYCTHVFGSFAKPGPTESRTPQCQKLRKRLEEKKTPCFALTVVFCLVPAALQGRRCSPEGFPGL